MKKIIASLIFTLLIVAGVVSSCRKDDNTAETDAVISFTGEVALDGCDWIVRTADGIDYHADNLSDTYKQDKLSVHLKYKLLNSRFSCGMVAGKGLPIIHIQSIRKN